CPELVVEKITLAATIPSAMAALLEQHGWEPCASNFRSNRGIRREWFIEAVAVRVVKTGNDTPTCNVDLTDSRVVGTQSSRWLHLCTKETKERKKGMACMAWTRCPIAFAASRVPGGQETWSSH